MNKVQHTQFNSLYQRHVSALQRQGKAKRTIDSYSHAYRTAKMNTNERPRGEDFIALVLQHALPSPARSTA